MLELLKQFTPGDWLAAVTGIFIVGGTVLGFVWWLSASFSEIKTISTTLTKLESNLSESTQNWATESERHWLVHEQHRTKLDNHDGRLIRVETVLDIKPINHGN